MTDLNAVLNAEQRIQVGNFMVQKGDLDRAYQMFVSVLDMDDTNLSALCNTAFMMMKRKDINGAKEMIGKALALDPNQPHTLGIAALIEQETPSADKFEVARDLFERSIKNGPPDATRLLNYAYMLQLIGDYPRALEIYTQARDLNPMDINTRFQRSMCMMTLAETTEEWRQALDEYEIRHLLYATGGQGAGKPMYTGREQGDTSDKTLLITHEQGIGDCVQMARYARFLKKNNIFKAVYFLVRPGWEELVLRFEGVDGVYTHPSHITHHDYFIPAFSLMRATGYPEVKPSNEPYLKRNADVEFGSKDAKKLKVGLCWQGNASHGNDRWRSIGPDLFSDALADITGVDFYSLHTPDINRLKPEFVHDCNVSTLASLADVIQSMDMIYTVDTAILHIAGSLGIPTIGLLYSNQDWRWGLRPLKSDWYPSIDFIQADKPLNWKPVLEKAAKRVQMFADMHRSGTV